STTSRPTSAASRCSPRSDPSSGSPPSGPASAGQQIAVHHVAQESGVSGRPHLVVAVLAPLHIPVLHHGLGNRGQQASINVTEALPCHALDDDVVEDVLDLALDGNRFLLLRGRQGARLHEGEI